MADLSLKLTAFEGPLDLLLHLIERDKVDIYDIPIVTITQQYLDYMNQMDTTDMDLMSEFLVMAATLVRIKSKMLLPVEETEEEDGFERMVGHFARRIRTDYSSAAPAEKQPESGGQKNENENKEG